MAPVVDESEWDLDRADRFLAATAVVYGLTLVTADAQLMSCPSLVVLANL